VGAGGIATEDEIDFDTFAGCVRGDLGTDAVLEHLPDLAVWATKATKINRLPTRRGVSTALRHKSIRPYALYRSRTAVFVGCQRPWNVGYGFNSSAAGWLTVSGRRAFRDDWTAN